MDMEIPREADLMDHPILFRECLARALPRLHASRLVYLLPMAID
jgi:hypothetical protein